MSAPLAIGYFADGAWAHQALDRFLHDPSIRVAFICARSGHPDPFLRKQAEAHGIDFFAHEQVKSDAFYEKVTHYRCDLFVSMSFDQIFDKRLIDLPRLQTINCHAGALPRYRGRNVLNWVLINDEKEFGITVHHVDEGIDTGDILAQRTFPITDDDTYATLLERAYPACAELLHDTVRKLMTGEVVRRPQALMPPGFYCAKRKEGDERLDWTQSSRDVFNFVRALCRPGVEARTFHRDAEIRINRVDFLPDAPRYKGIPGAVVGVEPGALMVKTGDSYVKVSEWTGVRRIRVGDRLA